jgi:DNA replication protein DnaC
LTEEESNGKLNGDYSEENTNTLLCGKCGRGKSHLIFDFNDTIAITYECMDCGKMHFVCAIRQERRGVSGHETT